MSDYVDSNMQDQPFEEDFPLVDWARLEDDALHRPWFVFGGPDSTEQMGTWYQAATEQSGRRHPPYIFQASDCPRSPSNQVQDSDEHTSMHNTHLIEERECSTKRPYNGQFHVPLESLHPTVATPSTTLDSHSVASLVKESPRYVCKHEDCDGTSFKRPSELNRHQRKHGQQPLYSCPAQGCDRIGRRGFPRQDKLRDHVIAGHDDNSLFCCPLNRCQEMELTKDMLSIHVVSALEAVPWIDQTSIMLTFKQFGGYRTCPIPKCPFRFVLPRNSKPEDMDPLPRHLLTHSAKGRANFAHVILQRGYDAGTGEVICPICPRENRFQGHLNFYSHFFRIHCVNIIGYSVSQFTSISPGPYGVVAQIFQSSTCIAEKAYTHRRTLLSLWPAICCYPVWKDIKCPGLVAGQREL